jgi:hypothetical protein
VGNKIFLRHMKLSILHLNKNGVFSKERRFSSETTHPELKFDLYYQISVSNNTALHTKFMMGCNCDVSMVSIMAENNMNAVLFQCNFIH